MSFTAVVNSSPAYFQPSWDETIVPALRKRLESESLAISKRMSTASLSDDDGLPQSHKHKSARTRSPDNIQLTPTRQAASNKKPSAIPRPSLQQARSNADDAGPSNSTGYDHQQQQHSGRPPLRQRTYSQPYFYEEVAMSVPRPAAPADPPMSLLPTPASSRPSSPDHAQPSRTQPENYYQRGNGNGAYRKDTSNHYQHPSDNSQPYAPSSSASHHSNYSTTHTYRQQESVILHEQAPFTVNSSQSSFHENAVDFPTRPSVDEERPFQHWYRGEVSRNGGVGELRIASRKEMLDIANYGHVLRRNPSRTPNPNSTMTPYMMARALRPGSIDPRGSFYLEDYDDLHNTDANMVLDEMPLTDLDVDTETDRESEQTRHTFENKQQSMENISSTTASRLTPPSRLPTPARAYNGTASSATLAAAEYTKGLSSPPNIPSTSTAKSHPQRITNVAQSAAPLSQSLSAAQKRGRTKSPPASANKKPKSATTKYKRSKSAIDVRRRTDEDENTSSAYDYPDDMVDAIPSWTQPNPKSGNWDEVVLPVVARKMGLDDQYIQANGSPKQSPVAEDIPSPAPGTFGFDHEKYRKARERLVTMDEFGRYDANEKNREMSEKQESNANSDSTPAPAPLNTKNLNAASKKRRETAPPSPAPFSHYAALAPESGHHESRALASDPVTVEVEESAGCCANCVIM